VALLDEAAAALNAGAPAQEVALNGEGKPVAMITFAGPNPVAQPQEV
jgi:hypothetical protein